ncbi:hypothetical protein FGADI_10230 [Fusarium gaditjirri]|uniref:aldehyde dehydrogenase (NAD(+)) n=1 Tax=Fusarium gaditjirri TaxID=282569 RepID=A0A8H4WRZ1_9HYPO|nr:hypothetical protein FGADI_10230 [Fusarium gaditjirri]
MLLCGKLSPALIAGNYIIIKPSPFTPYCSIKIVKLTQRFFPPSVVQVASFIKHISKLKVGDGFTDSTFIGPVQNQLQFERVQVHLDEIVKNNYTVLKRGDMSEGLQKGFFIQPTVVDNPPDDSKIVTEEPFGPVVPLLKWSGVDEVLSRVNASDMGLGASVWTADEELGMRIADELDVGSVWFNEHLAIEPTATFGGHKNSGLGRKWGVDGLRGYCNSKTYFAERTK